jgi:hypothetical protein
MQRRPMEYTGVWYNEGAATQGETAHINVQSGTSQPLRDRAWTRQHLAARMLDSMPDPNGVVRGR